MVPPKASTFPEFLSSHQPKKAPSGLSLGSVWLQPWVLAGEAEETTDKPESKGQSAQA